jgi:hypothetical protein
MILRVDDAEHLLDRPGVDAVRRRVALFGEEFVEHSEKSY